MWNNFWPDLLVAIIGTFVGSVFAVAIAFGTYLVQRREREKHALQMLIEEIHEKRALSPIDEPQVVPGAKNLDDFKYVSMSILNLRDRIRVTRELVPPSSSAQKNLSRMTRACNEYLENSTWSPESFAHDLMTLRAALWTNIEEISRRFRSIEALKPGEGPFEPRGSTATN